MINRLVPGRSPGAPELREFAPVEFGQALGVFLDFRTFAVLDVLP